MPQWCRWAWSRTASCRYRAASRRGGTPSVRAPGEDGASVLAGHVDYDGLPGVFFELASATVGDKVVVQLDDGVERTFELTEVTRYDKDSLPADAVWRRDGDPTLVLITCGGAFDPVRRTYESNTVAFARLVV